MKSLILSLVLLLSLNVNANENSGQEFRADFMVLNTVLEVTLDQYQGLEEDIENYQAAIKRAGLFSKGQIKREMCGITKAAAVSSFITLSTVLEMVNGKETNVDESVEDEFVAQLQTWLNNTKLASSKYCKKAKKSLPLIQEATEALARAVEIAKQF